MSLCGLDSMANMRLIWWEVYYEAKTRQTGIRAEG